MNQQEIRSEINRIRWIHKTNQFKTRFKFNITTLKIGNPSNGTFWTSMVSLKNSTTHTIKEVETTYSNKIKPQWTLRKSIINLTDSHCTPRCPQLAIRHTWSLVLIITRIIKTSRTSSMSSLEETPPVKRAVVDQEPDRSTSQAQKYSYTMKRTITYKTWWTQEIIPMWTR